MGQGLGAIKFKVPRFGYSVAVMAELGLMADQKIGLHSLKIAASENPPEDLAAQIALLNQLIDFGMPWSAIATCRNAPGLFGALIEAADNRLIECGSGNREAGDAA